MPLPKISVIMPVYNGGRFLAEAVESIMQQSFSDFEFIIVDDASTDETPAILRQYDDSRIKVVRNELNQGNYKSRNLGWKKARGKFICVMDADDVADPDKLRVQYRFMMKHPRVALAGSCGHMCDEVGNITGHLPKPLTYAFIKTWLFQNNAFIHSSMMINAELAAKYYQHYNTTIPYSADYALAVQFARRFPVCNLEENLIRYRVHGKQISTRVSIEQEACADRIRLWQLHSLDIRPSSTEKNLHLQLMKGHTVEPDHMPLAESWCNRLIQQNNKRKIYPENYFYELLQNLLLHQLEQSE